MEKISIIGLDLAKNTIQVHAACEKGAVLLRKKISRGKLLQFLSKHNPCTVAMEACAGAHYWGREISRLGHTVRLVAPVYVKPFVKRQKNDAADAEAICEATLRPTMRFVSIKSETKQASSTVFKVRDLLVRQKTQIINALRGHLGEFGITVPRGPSHVALLIPHVEDPRSDLPEEARSACLVLVTLLRSLVDRIRQLDQEITRRARHDDVANLLMTIPGIGPVIATALEALAPPAETDGHSLKVRLVVTMMEVRLRLQRFRLGCRFGKLLKRMGCAMGESIPLVCQDWANTKAAYRFFANERVSEADILGGHFQSTRDRFVAADGPVLILHDTTEFIYEREQPALIGSTKSVNSGRDKAGRVRSHTICGILMHSSLAVTTEGLPFGLTAVKFWTRKKFKGTNALKKRINPTRVPIERKESVRWLENLTQSTELLGETPRCVHIGDRENDIYELFCTAHAAGTHFLVRTCVDRLAGDGNHTISDEMAEVAVKGLHRVEVGDGKGGTSQAVLELRYRRIHVLPPIGKQKRYPALDLTVIHAQERGAPKGRKPIDWKLLTNLPVGSKKDAIEKLNWYAMRWKIEVFHKILKSGCKAEHSKLRTAQRLANLIAVFCILSWRVFWMTMMNRATQNASPKLALTDVEITLLDNLVSDTRRSPAGTMTLPHYLIKIARLAACRTEGLVLVDLRLLRGPAGLDTLGLV